MLLIPETLAGGCFLAIEGLYSIVDLTINGVITGLDGYDKNESEDPTGESGVNVDCQAILNRNMNQTLILTQIVVAKKPNGISNQTLVITQNILSERVKNQIIVQTLNITDSTLATRGVIESLIINQIVTPCRLRNRTVQHTLTLTQNVARRNINNLSLLL